MGRWIDKVVNFGMLVTLLLVVITHSTEAQTQVGFEFKEAKYSSIAENVGVFQSSLVADIMARFNFSQTEISSMQVTNGSEGRIRVNFKLIINTAVNAKVQNRTLFEQSLRTENYVLVFNASKYTVDSSSVQFSLSILDIWHQYAPEIVISVMFGLMAFAIFTVSIQLLCMNRSKKKVRDVEVPMHRVSAGNPSSPYRVNGGFFIDESNTGHRSYTPKSSMASIRYSHVQDQDTLYDKLIHADYAVPAKQMYDFL